MKKKKKLLGVLAIIVVIICLYCAAITTKALFALMKQIEEIRLIDKESQEQRFVDPNA